MTSEDNRHSAFNRISYGLVFTTGERRLRNHGIDSPEIPDSRFPSETIGGFWGDSLAPNPDTSDRLVIRNVFKSVIHEAVHEALEWLRVDGELLLDPHGSNEISIAKDLDAMALELWEDYVDH